jgi:DNA-binding MarR family transcriptional regulator
MPSKSNDAARVEDQLCFALYAAARAASAVYRPYLEPVGLTYPRYLVMLALWEHEETSIGQLGRRLFLDSGTLSPLLKKLESDGLVKRVRDPDDERVVKVKLTPQGRALEESMARMRSTLSCRLGLPAKEADELRNRVRMLFTQLMQLAEEPNETGVHSGGDGHGRSRRTRNLLGQEPRRAPFPAEGIGRQRRARNDQP